MIRKTDYYKKMKSIEHKCYVDIILMMEEMGIVSLRLDTEDFDEVSVLTYSDWDGGAVKRIVSEICLDSVGDGQNTLVIIDECDEEISIHDMVSCDIIWIYEAVMRRYKKVIKTMGKK